MAPKIYKGLIILQEPNHIIHYLNKTDLCEILGFIAHAVNFEWSDMWLPASVSNHGSPITSNFTPYSIMALSTGVNIDLSCIHKGLMPFSRVTLLIRMYDKIILTWFF